MSSITLPMRGSEAQALGKLAARKGVTVSELATLARVASKTIARINRDERVSPKVWGRLLRTAETLPDLPYADEVLAS